MRRYLLVVIALVLMAGLVFGGGQTESTETESISGEWTPTEPIQIVVPFAAGGNTDVPARIFAKYMTKYSDVPVEVVNITGGSGGSAGAKEVQKSKPDGTMFVVQPVAYPMLAGLGVQDYTNKDFEMVGQWLHSSLVVVVRADSEYETMEDLIAAAKANPGKIGMGSVTSTLPFFAVLEIAQQKNVEFKLVDLAQAQKASELLGGRVDGYIDGIGAVRQFIDSGDFRSLGAVTSFELPGYEFIPTFNELGFKDFGYLQQDMGLWAPGGTPRPILEYVNNVMKQAAEDPECIAEFTKLGVQPAYMTIDEYSRFMDETYKMFAEKAKIVTGG